MMPSYRDQLIHQLQCEGAFTETGARELADAAIGEGLEAYPGELAMLRTLARTLRVASRDRDFAAIEQALISHASDDAAARDDAKGKSSPTGPDATPSFFQPGHTYAFGDHRFQCVHLVAHPAHGGVVAWGWFGRVGTGAWRHTSFGRRQYEARAWADATEDVETR
jgi:hypothetical protein